MSNILKGKLGFKGERGYSAYEIAVQHGYTGTEEQWSEDFLNAENYYDKSEIDTMKADYVLKGDFAVVTGSMAGQSASHINFDYPTGFNKNNCVIISAMKKIGPDNEKDLIPQYLTTDNTDMYFEKVRMTDNKIVVWDTYVYLVAPSTTTYYYTIVLMKTGE